MHGVERNVQEEWPGFVALADALHGLAGDKVRRISFVMILAIVAMPVEGVVADVREIISAPL